MRCCCATTWPGLLRTLWQGVRIDDEMLALDLAREVGPRGNYLAHRHTVSHCREQLWNSRYFGPSMPLSTDVRARQGPAASASTPTCGALVAQHVPQPMAPISTHACARSATDSRPSTAADARRQLRPKPRWNHVFMTCVSARYTSSIAASTGQ